MRATSSNGRKKKLRRAETADHPEAARAHALLAGYYLDLVHSFPDPI